MELTPKEKAKELVKKFRDEIEMESDNGFDIRDEPNLQHLGKQSALICLERERQAEFRGISLFHAKVTDERLEEIFDNINKEYEKVKQEIEKLLK